MYMTCQISCTNLAITIQELYVHELIATIVKENNI